MIKYKNRINKEQEQIKKHCLVINKKNNNLKYCKLNCC